LYYFILALISAALFGAATPASKILLTAFNPFQLAGLLYLGAALGAATISLQKGNRFAPRTMDRRNLLRLGGAIVFGGVLAPSFLLLGLKLASAASVSLWLPLELVATAVLGSLLFHDQLGRYGWLGMAGIVLAGLLLGMGEGSSRLSSGLLVALACICWGFDNNLTALIDGITPAQSAFWKGIFAGSINLSIGYLVGGNAAPPPPTIVAALAVGALSYGISIVLYITAAQKIGASRAQMFFASNPFFALTFSAIILGEVISSFQISAAFLLLGSLTLVFRDRHEHWHQHEEIEHQHVHDHDDKHHDHDHGREAIPKRHSHHHRHEASTHSHPHWPDLHHRHKHYPDRKEP
jgi:drug/metabolite transporter (DMT)-like permease